MKLARMKVSEFIYPYCSQALAAIARMVPLAQPGRAMHAQSVPDVDSRTHGHCFPSEPSQRLAPILGSGSERALLFRTVAPHEDHEVIRHTKGMIALCQCALKNSPLSRPPPSSKANPVMRPARNASSQQAVAARRSTRSTRRAAWSVPTTCIILLSEGVSASTFNRERKYSLDVPSRVSC